MSNPDQENPLNAVAAIRDNIMADQAKIEEQLSMMRAGYEANARMIRDLNKAIEILQKDAESKPALAIVSH